MQHLPSRKISFVSFVVPAWNEEAHLGATLSSIREAAQHLDVPFEIVVANDGSTDRTGEIAAQLADRMVLVHHRQISATRNAGARASKGDLLIFVDADTAVTPKLVTTAVTAIQGGAIGGGCVAKFDGRVPVWGSLAPVLGNFYCRLFRVAYGCFLFCTRDAFDAVGGFDASMYMAEEIAISQALKRQGKFVVLPEPVVTSGRKVRAYTLPRALMMSFRAVIHGFRTRRGKELWYGERVGQRNGPAE